MGRMDALTKEYLRKNRIFADLVNMAIFQGKQRIRPQDLRELDTKAEAIIVGGEKGKTEPVSLTRDIFKECMAFTDGENTYLYIGIENQRRIDYAMPLRVAVSNDLFWLRQLREKQHKLKEEKQVKNLITSVSKGTKLNPVITIVVYWGDNPWDGPRTLREMVAPLAPELEALIPEYPCIIIEPRALSKAQIDSLQSDLKIVFQCMQRSKGRKALKQFVESEQRFKDLDTLAGMLINEMLHLKLCIPEDQKEGKIDMCQAWKEILMEERKDALKSVKPQLRRLKTLEAKYESVKAENKSVKAENKSVKARNVSLEAEIASLKAELQQMRDAGGEKV